jgi:GTP diphosphokinase / guanosine-3',5'-bis(diphosphate) 3'-diphosphatase
MLINGTEADYKLIEQQIEEIIHSCKDCGDGAKIRQAYGLLKEFAALQKDDRWVVTAIETARIAVSELNLSTEPVLAILLKFPADVSHVMQEQVVSTWGRAVWELISGLQKIDRLDTSKSATNTENFIRLLLTLSDDIRVILVHLSYHIQKIRRIGEYPEEEQKKITGESSLLYIPIVHRIGLYGIKTELEDRVFHFNDPETYHVLEQKLRETQKERDRYTKEFIAPIEKRLKENGFDCEIKSRVKSIPSIQRKILAQRVEFEKIYDLFAIRIIQNNTIENEKADCWKIYSLVTDIYAPNPRRLRDWISFPKSTGYESLHTTVIGPEGRWVEVQIRNRRMDEIAEKSLAAHWKYKMDSKSSEKTEFFAALRGMLENPLKSKEKSVTQEKKSLYTDEIFIFTPKGDLKKLKAGYTVLDFAYEVHSSVGSTCTGAIVNGVMVPLKHVLSNGDTVKVLTSRTQKPSHNWLEFVKSPRVINRIRHSLKMEAYKDSEAGKEIIRNKIIQMGLEFNDLMIRRLIDFFGCENHLDLYQRFGEGKIDPMRIRKAIAETEPEEHSSIPQKEESFPETLSGVMTGKQDFIIIDKRLNSVHYEFARCCNPVPGDTIFAFISITQGIRIHKTNCSNAHEMITRYPYRILEARWKEVETEKAFTANLSISGQFSEGILNKLTQFVTHDLKTEVRSSRLTKQAGNTYQCELGIKVRSKTHLDEVINRLKQNKDIGWIKMNTDIFTGKG